MVLKIFRAVWFLSLVAALAVFLYVYASLPEQVALAGDGGIALSREAMFYCTLALLAVFNMMVFVFNRLYSRQSADFLAWFHGLMVCFNLFIIILLGFINLYNSGERFDYPRLGVMIYGSIGLLAVWMISWPVVAWLKKIFAEKAV